MNSMLRRSLCVFTFYAVVFFAGMCCAESTVNKFLDEGVDRLNKGQVKDAVYSLQKAVEAEPNNSEAYATLGVALRAQELFEDSVKACRKALSLAPDVAEYYLPLASSLYMLGKKDEAIEACQKAITLDPFLPAAHMGLGEIYLLEGKKEEAKTSILKAKELFAQQKIPEGVSETQELLNSLN